MAIRAPSDDRPAKRPKDVRASLRGRVAKPMRKNGQTLPFARNDGLASGISEKKSEIHGPVGPQNPS
jgi:hypothetical protein